MKTLLILLLAVCAAQAQKKDLYQESEILLGKSKSEVIAHLKTLTMFPHTGDYNGRERVSWDDNHESKEANKPTDFKQAYKAYYFTNGICDSIAFRVVKDNDLNNLVSNRYQFIKKDSTVGKMAIKVLSAYQASSYQVDYIRAVDKTHRVADQYHLLFYVKD